MTYDELCKETGCDSFEYGRLFLREEETSSTLIFTVSGTKYIDTGNIHRSLVLEINPKNGQICSVQTPLPEDMHGIYAFAENKKKTSRYYASGLNIVGIEGRMKTQKIIRGGISALLGVVYTPDTKKAISVTANPARIHIFNCENDYWCQSQIVPQGITRIDRYALCRDRNSQKLYLLVQNRNKQTKLINLDSGITTNDNLDGDLNNFSMRLLTSPTVSILSKAKPFKLTTHGQSILIINVDTNKETQRLEVHPEWLFAGCEYMDPETNTCGPLFDRALDCCTKHTEKQID